MASEPVPIPQPSFKFGDEAMAEVIKSLLTVTHLENNAIVSKQDFSSGDVITKKNSFSRIIAESGNLTVDFTGVTTTKFLVIKSNKVVTVNINGTTDSIAGTKLVVIQGQVTSAKITAGGSGTGDHNIDIGLYG